MKGLLRIGLVSVAFVVVAAVAYSAGEAAKPVTFTPDQLKWAPAPGIQGVMTAVVWGDPATGPHAAFDKFTAGFDTPLHTHSSNNRIVVLAGTMAMAGKDGKEMQFPAGSFYTQPNTYEHTTKCLAGADCMVFLEADAAWDLKPVAKQ
jgi:anti-sigma factor ChrR (cupin superfamily)